MGWLRGRGLGTSRALGAGGQRGRRRDAAVMNKGPFRCHRDVLSST